MSGKIDKGLALSIIATLVILLFATMGIYNKTDTQKDNQNPGSIESLTKNLEENSKKLDEILKDLEKTEKALKEAREILERESREK